MTPTVGETRAMHKRSLDVWLEPVQHRITHNSSSYAYISSGTSQ
jgi:hypothetical protein